MDMLVFPSDGFLECHTPETGDVSELAETLRVCAFLECTVTQPGMYSFLEFP
jgi:hypothetical protein